MKISNFANKEKLKIKKREQVVMIVLVAAVVTMVVAILKF